jgi:hypothetical protein
MPKSEYLRRIDDLVGGRGVVVSGRVGAGSGGNAGSGSDHGGLAGLSDDDHPQYLTDARHAAIDAAEHGSGAAEDGYVLTADGAGGTAWEEAVLALPDHDHTGDGGDGGQLGVGALDRTGADDGDVPTADGAGGVAWGPQSGGSGASVFTGLGDVPPSYAGHGGKYVAVKAGEDGLEFL